MAHRLTRRPERTHSTARRVTLAGCSRVLRSPAREPSVCRTSCPGGCPFSKSDPARWEPRLDASGGYRRARPKTARSISSNVEMAQTTRGPGFGTKRDVKQAMEELMPRGGRSGGAGPRPSGRRPRCHPRGTAARVAPARPYRATGGSETRDSSPRRHGGCVAGGARRGR